MNLFHLVRVWIIFVACGLTIPGWAAGNEILVDSDFENLVIGEEWPEGWPQPKEARLVEEEGNTFLRMESQKPGSTVMLYREIHLPEGTEALEFTWRQRVSHLKRGKKSWFDARIMMEYMDGNRGKIGPKPPTPSTRKNTDGWQEKELRFNVPEGARILKFMPSLFQVESGTYDFDDVVLKTIPRLSPDEDPAQMRKAAQRKKIEVQKQKAAARLEANGDMFLNGDFETDSNGDGRPDHWGQATYLTEDGNTYMRLNAKPDELVMYYQKFDVPSGVEAFELSWRWRIQDLKPGAKAWFDARIMMNFIDASGKKHSISPPYSRHSSDGWQERRLEFLVPEDAVSLEFMPSLFNVKSGVLDLDDLSMKPVEAGPLKEKQAVRAAEKARLTVAPEVADESHWPPVLKVRGNRLVDPEGNEVWLQGVNIASLEWSQAGENVLKSAEVSIEQWGASVIRLPVKSKYWFGDEAEKYRQTVDHMIIFAANRGVYTVLDLHHYRAPREGDIEFWEDAATRYKNHPAVLFDLLNEPHSTSWEVWRNGGFVADKEQPADEDAFLSEIEKQQNAKGFMAIGMQKMVDTVRETGANNIVVVGGLDWAYDLSGILNGFAIEEHPGGHGVMYSTHVYPWKSDWQNSFLEVAKVHPILVGEVGADEKKMSWMPEERQEDWQTWVPRMLNCIQENRLNWTAWCFHPKASPRILLDWEYTPTPFWGVYAKEALSGKRFDSTPLP
ncbi:cellulase family glycosylhydrolase [Kiritimatiellaeota bacterium B1221]|nr:cellulase family glycosylhydrolase [Kiritimatiellaeota bacterium B1221]